MLPRYVMRTKKRFPELTKGLKKVADYLLNDPIIFAMHPAKKIGKIIGVSETMVIRFCNAIGYDGFSSLQEDVRNHLIDFNASTDYFSNQTENTSYLADNLQKDIQLFQHNMTNLVVDKYQPFIETIINSEKVVVSGYYQSFTFAYWFHYNLNYILGNAYLYRPEMDNHLLDLLPKRACVVIFSFYRYALDAIRFAEEAKSKGVKVIAFTDSRVAPVADLADQVIVIHFGNDTVLRKGPITISMLNGLLYEIFKQSNEASRIPTALKYFIKDGENNID